MIKFFVDRPLFTTSIFITLLVVGMFTLTKLPIDLLPDISFPSISIITVYPGAGAEDIEATVTKYIEDAVSTAPNLDKVTSNSVENLSTVTVSFKWGTNLDQATSDIRDKIDLIKSKLPSDAQNPTIFKFDLSMIPVLTLGITADQSYDNLYQITDKKIAQALKHIQGVGSVSISGGKKRQINVDIDRSRLYAYNLSLPQILGSLQAANLTVPVGSLKVGELEYSVRIPGEYKSVAEMQETIVGSMQNRNIYLKDVADISDSFKEQQNIVKINGKPGLTVSIQKQSGSNTVNVSHDAQFALLKIKNDLPPDVKITVINDGADGINRSISNLKETLIFAFVFVVLTVFFFLRNIRGSAIISLAIPFSLIGTFIYLYFSGSSVNIVSLSALVIAMGIVVDDAIVVLENIYQHRDKKGEPLREAAIFGTGEVVGAVVASTLTNLVIFIPIVMISGFIAIFFKQLAFTITVVMAASLFTSLSLTPMLSSKFLEIKQALADNSPLGSFYKKSEEWFEIIENNYAKLISWALVNRKRVIIFAVLVFVLSLPLFAFLGSEFFPSQDTGQIIASIQMPVGTSWEETAKVMDQIEKIVNENVPETQYIMVSAGASDSSGGAISSMFGAKDGANYGKLQMKLFPKDQRKRSTDLIQRLIAEKALKIPGVKLVDFTSTSGANQAMGGGKPISVEIYGFNLDVTDKVAEDLKSKMANVPGIVDLTISRDKGNPEVWFDVDRAKAASLGLTMADIASTLRNNVYGNAITKYRDQGDEYDIFLRLKKENRKTLADLENIFITSRTGKNIALSNIAKVVHKNGPLAIQRKNQERYLTVESNYYKRSVGDINQDVQKIVNKIALPSGVSIKMGGSAEQMKESFSQLGMALILGILLIYLVMVAQFESIIDPFIIMFSVPFAIVGVIWGLFLAGAPFGIMPFIGTIMVVGIVVKNAIVFISYTNILRERGYAVKDAVLDAGKTRLRPILMTTATAILGLLPMALSRGEGAEFWSPLAYAILGGLTVSTLITLILVPVIYTIFEEKIRTKREEELS